MNRNGPNLLIDLVIKGTKSMDNIIFSVWVSSRLEFSADEKRACFDIAKRFPILAFKVRKQGLLSVEEEIAATHNAFLKIALQLAVDSTAPEHIKNIMQNWIIFGNYRGEKLLRRLIIIDGVLMLAKGDNPNHINTVLASFFGEALHAEYDAFTEAEKIEALPFLMEDLWYNIKDKQMHRENGANLLESTFRQCNNTAMQILLRNIDMHDLILAAKASSEYVIHRVLNNVSNSIAHHLVYEMYNLKIARLADAIVAQNRILAKIKHLEECGEIVLRDNSAS